MKICFTPPYYPPHVGGLEQVSWNISTRLSERDHDISVITTEDDSGKKVDIKKVNLIRLKVDLKVFNTPVSLSLKRELEKTEPDIFYAHAYPVWFCDITRMVANRRKTPFILHWHGDPRETGNYKYNPLAKLITDVYFRTYGKKLFDSAKKIVTPSNMYKNYIISQAKVDASKIEVIPNGIDTEKFKPCAKRRDDVILFVGRISEQKNVLTLLKAWELVQKENPVLKLWIVGGVDQKEYGELVFNFAKKLKNVTFFGPVKNDELPKFYSQATLLAFPSLYESFGNVPLEAMACGCPVISTATGVVPEYVENAGVLLNPYDVVNWANTINNMISDKTKRREFGKSGMKLIVNTMSWSKNIALIEKLCSDVI